MRLADCEALATDEWFAISDHAPIAADPEDARSSAFVGWPLPPSGSDVGHLRG